MTSHPRPGHPFQCAPIAPDSQGRRWRILRLVAHQLFLVLGTSASLLLLPADSQAGVAQAEKGLLINVTARTFRQGEAVSVRVRCTCPGPLEQVRGEVFGQPLQFTVMDQEWWGLAGIDLSTKAGTYSVSVEAQGPGQLALRGTRSIRVAARTFPVRRLRVASQFVEPSEEDQLRIVREAERIAGIFQAPSMRTWDGTFVRPLMGPVTSNFGARTVFNGQSRAPHAGIDFTDEVGTPAASPSAGRIVLAEDLFFTGGTIIIDHGQGLYSLFAHLSGFVAHEGEDVAQGAVVGFVGATGRVTGPHLHWAIRLNGARVDPLSMIEIARIK
jgi:murein DD-endopeptidase MepM/ murein hydrolase activator NlpD